MQRFRGESKALSKYERRDMAYLGIYPGKCAGFDQTYDFTGGLKTSEQFFP